jgi:hypothetical protein
LFAGVQHRGGVGRIAKHDQVGALGYLDTIEAEGWLENHMVHRHSGRAQRHRRLGERRRDDRGQLRAQVGQQREPLGRTGQRKNLVAGSAVPLRDRVLGPMDVRDGGIAA